MNNRSDTEVKKQMKIYRVSLRGAGDEHDCYVYYGGKTTAEREQKKENKSRGEDHMTDEVEEIEFTLTKKGVIEMMNTYAAYPDNG